MGTHTATTGTILTDRTTGTTGIGFIIATIAIIITAATKLTC
jgi:hypothetical protein